MVKDHLIVKHHEKKGEGEAEYLISAWNQNKIDNKMNTVLKVYNGIKLVFFQIYCM